jgi:hypothetical protein
MNEGTRSGKSTIRLPDISAERPTNGLYLLPFTPTQPLHLSFRFSYVSCSLAVDGRIILRWIFRKWDVGVWAGSSWLRIRTGGG